MTLILDYFYVGQSDHFVFYTVPEVLISDRTHFNVSSGAAILYGVMLDKMSLSVKKGWRDANGKIYIYLTRNSVQELLNCEHKRAAKLFSELENASDGGLIERVRQGLGKPARIYLKKFIRLPDGTAYDDVYFYDYEAGQYRFIKIPKLLITDKHYADLSYDAKILFSVLLDRQGLSKKNNWHDKGNRVYVQYSIQKVMETFGCGKDKAIKLFKELDSEHGIGLIERVNRGQTHTAVIYLKNFTQAADANAPVPNTERDIDLRTSPNADFKTSPNADFKTSPNADFKTSPNADFKTSPNADFKTSPNADFKTSPNADLYNMYSKTDINQTDINQSIYPTAVARRGEAADAIERIERYRELILGNINFEYVLDRAPYRADILNALVEVMVEAVTTAKPYLMINGEKKPSAIVKSTLLKLRDQHIEYVMECLQNNNTKITNIRAYLLTTLYNSHATIDPYFQNLVNYDLYGNGRENAMNEPTSESR